MDRPSELDLDKSLSTIIKTIPPFVGRGQELAWLEDCLQEAIAGHPQVVLIQGEAGIGKTRLLQEVRSGALRRGIQVCYGRCYEDLTLPYLPFVEAFRPLLEQLPHGVERALGTDAEVINRLLHRDAAISPAAGPTISAQHNQDKLQLILAVSRVTITLAQRCPMLFVVDDLHWADPSSLDLFGRVVFTVVDMAVRELVPLLLVATYRPAEPETRLARLIARCQREHICQTLELPGLNEFEIHELVQGLGLRRPSHQLITTVSGATQGNPLFIQEVLHHLVHQDALQERGGYVVTTVAPADLRLPDQVTATIVARTHEISESCRRVLTMASFLGDRFSLVALGAVSGVSEDTLLSLLEEGMHQRLLLSEGQTFQFAHPLIRHVFYHEPSAARRQRIHQQIAETLQCLYADSLDAYIIEIAHHLVKAGAAADMATVASYARQAAERAFTVFAWGEAALYYEAALAAAEATDRLSVQDRAELHYWAGLAHYRDQDVGPCLEHYEKAIEAHHLAGDVRGLAQALMERTRTYYTLASVPFGTLIDVQPLEDVLKALGDSEPALRGNIAAVMAEVYWTARQPSKAKKMAQQALEIGQRLRDDHLCAYASFALGLAQAQDLHVTETLESYRNALTYAQRADDLRLQGWWPLQRMSPILILLGRLDEAEAVALDAYESTLKTHDWGGHSLALSALASIAVARGDFAAVERHAHAAMLMVSRSRYPWGGRRSLLALAGARAQRGVWAEAQDALDMLLEPGRVFENVGPITQAFAQIFQQLLRAYSGIVDASIDSFAADLVRAAGIDSYALAPLCALVELGDLMAAPTVIAPSYEALSVAAERGVLFSNGWVFSIPRILGVAAAFHHWWETAEAYFQAAIEAATSAGARPELGRSYLDYARMLATRGGKANRRRAVELVSQAGVIFHALGMEPFAQRAAQLAEALQARLPLVPRPGIVSPDHLSAQEVEVLLQIAQGRTDQEIADNLVLSLQTVARYVGSLFNKLKVTSRESVATYAFEKGLTSQARSRRRTEISPEINHVGGVGQGQPLLMVLVTEIEGSMALLQRLGDAQAHELLRLHNIIIRNCLRTHHGFEVTHTGDGVEASFLSASNAVACAVAIQKAFAKHNQEHPDSPIHIRIGINAGEPIPMEGQLFGRAVHTAFRICTRAQPGQILVSDVLHQLVAGKGFTFADRGRVTLKGLTGRTRLYEVRWEDGYV